MTTHRHIRINLSRQKLELFEGDTLIHRYAISSALNGAGEERGSECTPRGLHRIRIKIGADMAENTVFVRRRPTGETYSPELAAQQPNRDWILTRIMWLSGQQPGCNRGGHCDSLRRFIYIHGCPDSEPMGVPCSHGCIRMRNCDIIELFDLVEVGTPVDIQEG